MTSCFRICHHFLSVRVHLASFTDVFFYVGCISRCQPTSLHRNCSVHRRQHALFLHLPSRDTRRPQCAGHLSRHTCCWLFLPGYVFAVPIQSGLCLTCTSPTLMARCGITDCRRGWMLTTRDTTEAGYSLRMENAKSANA